MTGSYLSEYHKATRPGIGQCSMSLTNQLSESQKAERQNTLYWALWDRYLAAPRSAKGQLILELISDVPSS